MRRSLILTVAAAVDDGAARDAGADGACCCAATPWRTGSRAPRSRCRPPRPWSRAQRQGAVATYLDRINRGDGVAHHRALPPATAPDGDVGPDPGEDDRVVEARADRAGAASTTWTAARSSWCRSRSGGSSGAAARTPRSSGSWCARPGWSPGSCAAGWCCSLLGLVLLGRRAGARRPARAGRSCSRSARWRRTPPRSATDGRPEPVEPSGPPEVRELAAAMNRLVGRIEVLLERERAGVADVSHRLRTPITALRLRVDGAARPRRARPAGRRPRRAAGDGRPRGARGPALRARGPGAARRTGWPCSPTRARFWEPLAEDQGRPFEVRRSSRRAGAGAGRREEDLRRPGRRAARQRLHPHPRGGAGRGSRSRRAPAAGWC